MTKVMVIGLDWVHLDFLLPHLDQLTHLKKMTDQGSMVKMHSCHPPTTITSWPALATGLTPGKMGVYGSHQRLGHSLEGKNIWDLLKDHDYSSLVLGAPTHLPEKRTYLPKSIQVETVKIWEQEPHKEDLKEYIHRVYLTARLLFINQKPDFFMMVDPSVRKILSLIGNSSEALEYLKLLDREIGFLTSFVSKDTLTLILSSHGTKKMEGVFHINQWLVEEGYLTLKEKIEQPALLTKTMVDWKNTRAWGEGGVYGSIWLNVRRREPQGIIPNEKVEYIQNTLIHKMVSLTDNDGFPLYTRIIKPSKVYSKFKGTPPDIFFIFKDLHWGASSLVGTKNLYIADMKNMFNNSLEGLCISSEKMNKENVSIVDIAPTILNRFNITATSNMSGKDFISCEIKSDTIY